MTHFPNLQEALKEGEHCLALRRDPHSIESIILTELLGSSGVSYAQQSPVTRRSLFELELSLKGHTLLPTPLDYKQWLDEQSTQEGIIRVPHAIDEYIFEGNLVIIGYNHGGIFAQGSHGFSVRAGTIEGAYTALEQCIREGVCFADTQ